MDNPIENLSQAKHIAALGFSMVITAASFGYILPLLLNQDPAKELHLPLAIVTCSLLGVSLLFVLIAFLQFRFGKWSFEKRQFVYALLSLIGRVMGFAALICSLYLGACEKLPWLATLAARFAWVGIAYYFLASLSSVRDLFAWGRHPTSMAYEAYEEDHHAAPKKKPSPSSTVDNKDKEKTSTEGAIEVEVVDK